jgi:RNA polymerase sigma-70 factor, ECF subfamily
MAFGDTIKNVKKKALKPIEEAVPASSDQSIDRFEGTFREYWGKIVQLLRHITGDADEAEDLALEVFWRLYKSPDHLKQNPGGWLYRVAVRLAYNALRSRKRRQHYEEQAGRLIWENSTTGNPVRRLEKMEEKEQVRQALSRMKPRSSQILVLRHSGLSYQEVAEVMKIAPASIGTLLARAEKEFLQEYRKLAGD